MNMRQIHKQNLLEQFIYWIIWLIIFFAPLIGNLFTTKGTVYQSFSWVVLGHVWLRIIPFFILFLANNYVLIPYLLLRRRFWTYLIVSLLVVGALCVSHAVPPYQIQPGRRQPIYINFKDSLHAPIHQLGPVDVRESGYPLPDMDNDMGKGLGQSTLLGGPDERILSKNDQRDHFGPHDRQMKSMPTIEKVYSSINCFIIAILIIGFNIAVKLLFQSIRSEEKMKELESQRLQSELQYLRYQINPHFFMNTLNNIHALVDINTDKAKSSIIELSKLMRYVLYEASNQTISLNREIQFLNNYVTLMRLRYTDKVKVEMVVPSVIPEVQIPPLLFISFLENAFKHGVSYQKESYIKMKLQVNTDKKITFHCSNSNWGKVDEQHHGIGLDNISKRLKLLYGDKYTLSINENKEENSFNVLLIIPLL